MFEKSLLRLWLIAAVAAAVGGCSLPAFAGDVVSADEEVVTGSRIYTDLKEIPAPTYVIDRDAIERSGAAKLSDLLSKVPGIYTRSRAGNTQDEFIEMRGLTTEMLFLVDGVPYYKASHLADAAAIDLRSLPIDDIERIEIVKGASSSVYGSMAAAGVINIITRKPEGTGATVSVEGGTDDYSKESVYAFASGEKVNAGIWYTHNEEGESPLLSYSSGGTTIKDKNIDYDGDAGGFSAGHGPWNLSATWGDYSSKWTYGGYDQDQKNDYSRYNFSWNDGINSFILYKDYQEKKLVQDSSYGVSRTDVEDNGWGAEFSRRTYWGDSLVSWGMAFRDEDMDYDYVSSYGKTPYDMSRTNYAPFVEASVPVGNVLMNLGMRYENWDQDDADDYDKLIPHIAFSYQTEGGNLWYLSAGRFFAMPSLYELTYYGSPATIPNLSLKPEDGWNYEVGYKCSDAWGDWNVGLFYIEMDDKIDIKSDYSQYVNLAEFRSWGLEAMRNWKLSDAWNLGLGLTWMRPEEKDTGSSPWLKGGAPQWDINASLAYTRDLFSGEITVNYLGDRDDERAGIGPLSQEDVTTVDAMLQWKMGSGILRLSGYNIFDKDYYLQDLTNYGTTTRYYGGEARYYVTWQYKF